MGANDILRRIGIGVLSLVVWASAELPGPERSLPRPARAAAEDKQSVLGPGLYVFQTRVRQATCQDAEPDGYVLSFFAAIDGIPGSTGMTMQLVNTAYFKDWILKVNGTQVTGDSRFGKAADGPDSHFEVTRDGDRFKGTGYRSYNGTFEGKAQRCKVSYDALLKRLDV